MRDAQAVARIRRKNQGWVSVGIDHDTAEFAVHSIRQWWARMGRHRFPRARTLWITADGGGSNGPRSRLWKRSLQTLADDLGLTLSVCHFPPGTSKWNKIVKAALDTHQYATAVTVSDEDFARLHITPHAFHGDWNYTITPRR